MKKISIFDIKGGEILANPVITSAYQILLAEGTVLQKDYIEILYEGNDKVYVRHRLKMFWKNIFTGKIRSWKN